MKVYLLRGSPIALIIVSTAFSVLSLTYLLYSFIGKHILVPEICLFIAFSILYSTGISIAFYLAYRKSDYAFMSPKKYRKTMLIFEKNQKLMTTLEQLDSKNVGVCPDKAIDIAIEMLENINR
jgi:hypothetical protein